MSEHDCGGDAAAYALGALDRQEADAFRAHLESCVVCRDELAAFRPVVDQLPMTAPGTELREGCAGGCAVHCATSRSARLGGQHGNGRLWPQWLRSRRPLRSLVESS